MQGNARRTRVRGNDKDATLPPALRGMVSNAIKRWWPSLMVYPETNDRESPLLITWRGITYRVWCEQVRK